MNFLNVSKLYWNTGIGWPSIFFSLFMYSMIYLSGGWLKWVFISVSIFWTILIIYRYYRWNGSHWRKVHYQSMLAFSSMAGREAAESRVSGQEYNILHPIHHMLHIMSPNNDKEIAEGIFVDIQENGSDILYHILDKHIRGLLPDSNEIDLLSFMVEVAKSEVTPHLAIACIIEHKYGSLESAKYILALMKNEAS